LWDRIWRIHNLNGMSSLLYLIGARGTGKSTVGRVLAARLGWGFVDADERLEAAAGRTIADIFAAEGEKGFRDRESAVLAELAGMSHHVIATGGGIVLREANRELLRRSGAIVWLIAAPEAAYARLSADPTTAARRPNLTPQGGIEEVRAVMAAREPLYREVAQIIVDSGSLSPESVADAILTAWNGGITSRPSSGAPSPSSSD
jgi:shikimate kinase